MEIFIKGNVDTRHLNSTAINSDLSVRVKKESSIFTSKHMVSSVKNIEKGREYLSSRLSLCYNREFDSDDNWKELLTKRINNSLFSENHKKVLIDNIDLIDIGNSPLVYSMGGGRLIEVKCNESLDDLCNRHDIKSYPYTSIKLLHTLKDGTKLYGTDVKNILFGINNGIVTFKKYILSDEWCDDDVCDEGGYRTDLLRTSNIVKRKDGSISELTVTQCTEYEWLEVYEQLLVLPDSLKDFRLLYNIPCVFDRYCDIIKTTKIDYSYDIKHVKDNIYNRNSYKIYDKEKVIVHGGDGWRSNVTYIRFFDNVTELQKWKDGLSKLYVPRDDNHTRLGIDELCEENTPDKAFMSAQNIIIITKDGNKFIVDKYINTDRNRFNSPFERNISNPEMYRILSPNLSSLIPNLILKDSQIVVNAVTKEITEERMFQFNKSAYINNEYGMVALYNKVIIGDEIHYVPAYIKSNDGYEYHVSDPHNTTSQPSYPFTNNNGMQIYNPALFVWRGEAPKNIKRQQHNRTSHVSINTLELNKKSIMLSEMTFAASPSKDNTQSIFSKMEFSPVLTHWELPGNHLIPRTVSGNRDTCMLYSANSIIYNNDGTVRDRVKNLVETFINSKQQVIIAGEILSSRFYRGGINNVSTDDAEFTVALEHTMKCQDVVLIFNVDHQFIYYPNKMDMEALEYCNSELRSIEFEFVHDTKNKLDIKTLVCDGISKSTFIKDGIIENMDKTLCDVEDAINSYIQPLSVNTTAEEEDKLFHGGDEVSKIIHIMQAFQKLMIK